MIKRVNSHFKIRKPNFLHIQGLSSAYRSKSLTQINFLDSKKDDKLKTNASIDLQNQQKELSTKNFLSPQQFQNIDFTETENQFQYPSQQTQNLQISQKDRNNFNLQYHNQYSSLPNNSFDSEYIISSKPNYFSISTTSIESSIINTDCLDVPGKTKLCFYSTNSSNQNKNNLHNTNKIGSIDETQNKIIIQRGNSSDTSISDHSLYKKNLNPNKKSGPFKISCEDLENDKNDTVNFNKQISNSSNKTHESHLYHNCSSSQSHNLHLNRKSGGIFSNPFKNEREKMEQLTELLNYYDVHGIPCLSNDSQLINTKKHLNTIKRNLQTIHQPLSTQANSTTKDYSNIYTNSNETLHKYSSPITTFSNINNISNLNEQMNIQQNLNMENYLSSCDAISINKLILDNTNTCSKNSKLTCGIQLTNLVNSESNSKLNDFEEIYNKDSLENLLNENIFYLENNWTRFVNESKISNKKLHNQQDAIWELVTTEVSYIQKLKVITNLFRNCLISLQAEALLNDINTNKIFRNINEVINANLNFWFNYLLKMVNHSRLTGNSLNPLLMSDGFFYFEEIFKPYRLYFVEHLLSIQYVKKKQKENELFKTYVAWCETRKDCERLHMVDLLVNPMQRLTKYSLLIKAIQAKTDDKEQLTVLQKMNENVEKFVISINSCLCKHNQLEKLNIISKRIESYDVIESNNDEVERIIKEYRDLNLIQSMKNCKKDEVRQLLIEISGLKLKDAYSSSKIDVHCLLFTDILLLCKQVSKKTSERLKIIRQPFMVQRLRAHELKDQSGLVMIYLNELNVASTFFILYTSDTRILIQKLSDAQKLYCKLTEQKRIQTHKSKFENEIKPKLFLQPTKFTEDEYYDDYYDFNENEAKLQSLQLNNLSNNNLENINQQANSRYSFSTLSSTKSSSKSSLIKSLSNSIEQSEVSGYDSNQLISAPCCTTNVFYNERQCFICSNCAHQLNAIQYNNCLKFQNQSSTDKQSITSNTFESISTLYNSNQFNYCSHCNLESFDTFIKNKFMHKSEKKFQSKDQKNSIDCSKTNNFLFTNNLTENYGNEQQRAISFELGELRNPSLTVEDLDLSRSHSMENRCPVFLKITSPRPERRAFLLKGSGAAAFSIIPTNTTSIDNDSLKTVTNTFNSNIKDDNINTSKDNDTNFKHYHCNKCSNLINFSNFKNSKNVNLGSTKTFCSSIKQFDKSSSKQFASNKNSQFNVEYFDHSQKNQKINLNAQNLRKKISLDQTVNKIPQKIENDKSIHVVVPNICKNNASKLNFNENSNQITSLNNIKSSKVCINKPPLIKTKNIIITSTSNLLSKLTKSSSASDETSPQNTSFDSDQSDFLNLDEYVSKKKINLPNLENQTNNLNTNSIIQTQQIKSNEKQHKVECMLYNTNNNFLKNIPSFVIENQDDIVYENSQFLKNEALNNYCNINIKEKYNSKENNLSIKQNDLSEDKITSKHKLIVPTIKPKQTNIIEIENEREYEQKH